MPEFIEEILDQPQALHDTLDALFCGEMDEAFLNEWRSAGTVIFAGMGSSYFAPLAAMNLLAMLRERAFTIDASELLHSNIGMLRPSDLALLVSQSGESIETVKLLSLLKEMAVKTVAVSNQPDSTLVRGADHAILTRAGVEEMTSSKTFVSTLALLYYLSWLKSGNIPGALCSRFYSMPHKISKLLERRGEITAAIIDLLGLPSHLEIIARGPSLASARQAALVLKEAAGILSEAMAGGEFRHGPMEVVGPGFCAIIFAPSGPTYELNASMAADIVEFGGKVVFVTSMGGALKKEGTISIEIDEDDPFMFAMLDIQIVNLLAVEIARIRGCKPGSFSHGAKVTTKE